MAVVNVGLARSLLEEAEIADLFDLGMVAQEGADLGGVFARAVHPQFERFEAAHQHPRGVGVEAPPIVLRIIRTLSSSALLPVSPPATRSLWPPAYLVRL